MAHITRFYGKIVFSLLGLCLGGMLYASDPEVRVKHSVQILRNFASRVERVSTELEFTPRERLEVARETGRLVSFAYYQLDKAQDSLTQNQYLSYAHQIHEVTKAVKTVIRVNKRSRSQSL